MRRGKPAARHPTWRPTKVNIGPTTPNGFRPSQAADAASLEKSPGGQEMLPQRAADNVDSVVAVIGQEVGRRARHRRRFDGDGYVDDDERRERLDAKRAPPELFARGHEPARTRCASRTGQSDAVRRWLERETPKVTQKPSYPLVCGRTRRTRTMPARTSEATGRESRFSNVESRTTSRARAWPLLGWLSSNLYVDFSADRSRASKVRVAASSRRSASPRLLALPRHPSPREQEARGIGRSRGPGASGRGDRAWRSRQGAASSFSSFIIFPPVKAIIFVASSSIERASSSGCSDRKKE